MIDFEYTVLIRGSRHVSVLLCVHRKREGVWPILSVLLLTIFVTSRPSCQAGRGEEHRIQKTQTYTTAIFCHAPAAADACKKYLESGWISALDPIFHLFYSDVTCKIIYWTSSMLLNQPLQKLGQSWANSWHKSDQLANNWKACLVLLCATLTPLKQAARKLYYHIIMFKYKPVCKNLSLFL